MNKVSITLTLTEYGLKKFKNIPTFKNLLYPNQLSKLSVGPNLLTVNHTVWGSLQRVSTYDPLNIQVIKNPD